MQKGGEIINIVHLITTLERGGAQRILYEVIKKNKSLNFKHIVISLTEEKGFSKEIKNNVDKIYFLNGKNIFNFPILVFRAFLIIRNLKPDLIQSWLYHSDFIASILSLFLKRIPIIWTIHHASYSLKYESFHSKLIVYLLAKLSNHIPSQIIYCSQLSYEVHKKLGYKENKSKVILNGIDMLQFSPDKKLGITFKQIQGINEDQFVIGFVGRYDPNKGVDCFLKTIKEIKNKINNQKIIFLMCGYEMDKSNMELISKIKKMNLIQDIILLGEKSDMKSIYNSIDLLICTSLTESFGLVIVEALACGKTVIGSDIPALKKIIKIENLIEPNNYVLFAERSLNIIQNKNNQKSLSKTNRDSVLRKYNIDNTINNYYKIYYECL